MQSKDTLGDRMKEYEGQEAHRTFAEGLPICIRLDGRKFSTWTKNLHRPFDARLSGLMIGLTLALVKETSAKVGYTQSDEISLVLYDTDTSSEGYFGGRIQKIVSMTSAFASAWFAREVPLVLPEKATKMALFDSRAWTVPSLQEATNTLIWRELDASKNSISMAAQRHFSTSQLHKKTSTDKLALLTSKGVDWNEYPQHFRRGTYVLRRTETGPFLPEELNELPPKHQAHSNPDLQVTRSRVTEEYLPPLVSIWNREGVLFNGEPVVLKEDEVLQRIATTKCKPVESLTHLDLNGFELTPALRHVGLLRMETP